MRRSNKWKTFKDALAAFVAACFVICTIALLYVVSWWVKASIWHSVWE